MNNEDRLTSNSEGGGPTPKQAEKKDLLEALTHEELLGLVQRVNEKVQCLMEKGLSEGDDLKSFLVLYEQIQALQRQNLLYLSPDIQRELNRFSKGLHQGSVLEAISKKDQSI
ncbi:hypothetical protein IPG41_00985 [Candidatus Peregrinibacteria bacterium]|nr:MAG: hypothetical protein IPG41_00985 [Candidatus Peregrinibacteria bacterium]